jgi:cell shape-determining protein MreC
MLSSYFYDINSINVLLEENERLKNKITEFQLKSDLNNFSESNLQNKIFDGFKFLPVEILGQDGSHGMISTLTNIIRGGELVINNCNIIGKILYVGNQVSIVSLVQNKKFLLPFVVKGTQNTGLYSFYDDRIVEIKNFSELRVGDELITLEKNNIIPRGILIKRVTQIIGNKVVFDNQKCLNTNFGFIVTKK